MLRHFNIVVIFLLLLFALLYFNQSTSIHWLWYGLLFATFGAIEFYGAAYIQSQFHVKTFYKANTSEKVVALTFDDGPSAQTLKIMEVLKEFNVHATFFCIGKNIKGNEHILKQTFEAGHSIGNHSYEHGFFYDLKNTESLLRDMQQANEAIKNVIGKTPAYFRPPYGVTTPALARAVKKLKFSVIGWNIRSLDTKLRNPDLVLERVSSQLKNGSIILFHDSIDGTEIVLKNLLIYLREKNYKVVPLHELIQVPDYV